ncbi:MAG: hypothetical protein LQ340_006758 [Diploschistes diacapsis]|nr:MAG: hypothetical protein LQ340_006758 [Diploschistes diacapsis]
MAYNSLVSREQLLRAHLPHGRSVSRGSHTTRQKLDSNGASPDSGESESDGSMEERVIAGPELAQDPETDKEQLRKLPKTRECLRKRKNLLLDKNSGSDAPLQQHSSEMDPNEKPRKRKKPSKENGQMSLPWAKAPTPPQEPPNVASNSISRAENTPVSQDAIHSTKDQDKVLVTNGKVSRGAQRQRLAAHTSNLHENLQVRSGVKSESHGTEQVDLALLQLETPPKKMMKLRTDGRLGSPRSLQDNKVKRKRGRKPLAAKIDNRNPVVLRYGCEHHSRGAFGEKVASILSGVLRISQRSKEVPPKIIEKPAEPPKNTHPFFLGPSKPEPAAEVEASPKKFPAVSSPRKKRPSFTANLSRPWPTFSSCFNQDKLPRLKNSLPAPWPTGNMFYTEGLDLSRLRLPIRQYERQLPRSLAKSKEIQVSLHPREQILAQYSHLTDSRGHKIQPVSICIPARKVMSTKMLESLMAERITATHASRKPSPYAVKRKLEGLKDSLSAFDKFECENVDWKTKYAPKCAADVLQRDCKVDVLKSWLLSLTITTVDKGTLRKEPIKSKYRRKRRKVSDLDSFIVSDNDRDDDASDYSCDSDQSTELSVDGWAIQKAMLQRRDRAPLPRLTAQSLCNTRAVVVSGPHGCGKTAAVYAVAQELGFEIFEINSGTRRGGKDILDRVGDMARNHLVDRTASEDDAKSEEEDNTHVQEEIDRGRQSTMQSFFKPKAGETVTSKKVMERKKQPLPEPPPKKTKAQKQSLILLEEVDVLFEEDKNFWNTVTALLESSRRPIVMTCSDESLIPVTELRNCSILRLSQPPSETCVDYLLLIASLEGHLLARGAVEKLYASTDHDLRSSIQQLQFWCQMALKDPKGGLGWMLTGSNGQEAKNYRGEKLRVISDGTFQPFMDLLSMNDASQGPLHIDRDIALLREAIDNRLYNVGDWTGWLDGSIVSECLSEDPRLRYKSCCVLDSFYDAISAGDLMPGSKLFSATALDPLQDAMTEAARLSYTTGYPLLQTDHVQDATGMSGDIVLALKLCSRSLALGSNQPLDRSQLCELIVSRKPTLDALVSCSRDALTTALEPLALFQNESVDGKANSILGSENRLSNIAADICPFVRGIVSYDLQLEQERLRLSNLVSEGGRAGKKQRKTRASRAALEGGSKANTRRERWFTTELNFPLVLETAGTGWQEALRRWEKAEKKEENVEGLGEREGVEQHIQASSSDVDMLEG